jgi:hypothetical protein
MMIINFPNGPVFHVASPLGLALQAILGVNGG